MTAPRPNMHILCRKLPTVLSEIDVFNGQVVDMLKDAGLSKEVFPVQMLLRESINNAMIHGNAGQSARQVAVEVRIGRKLIIIRVEDEGAGFDWKRMRTTVPDATRTSGRGLPIYALYAKRTFFNKKGTQVTLVRGINGETHEPV